MIIFMLSDFCFRQCCDSPTAEPFFSQMQSSANDTFVIKFLIKLLTFVFYSAFLVKKKITTIAVNK